MPNYTKKVESYIPKKKADVQKLIYTISSESDSEPETSAKYRKQRSARLLRKKALVNGFLPAEDESDNSDSAVLTARELQTWNSHECAQKMLDLVDDVKHKEEPLSSENVDYYPIWAKCPIPANNNLNGKELKSVYETLYPTKDPPPPPLPPRAFPPGNSGHRPLERMRALPYPISNSAFNPPEVPRQHKPVFGLPSHKQEKHHRHLLNSGPSLPPKPKKLLNPEDSFTFEIIDTDEFRLPKATNCSSHCNAQPVVCSNALNQSASSSADSAISVPVVDGNLSKLVSLPGEHQSKNCQDVHKQLFLNLESSCVNPKNTHSELNSGVSQRHMCAQSESANLGFKSGIVSNHKRPIRLAMNDRENELSESERTEGLAIASAPLATPEQDGSLMDSSSVENLLDDDDDSVFLPQTSESVVPFKMTNGPEVVDVTEPLINIMSSKADDTSPTCYQSSNHQWPVSEQNQRYSECCSRNVNDFSSQQYPLTECNSAKQVIEEVNNVSELDQISNISCITKNVSGNVDTLAGSLLIDTNVNENYTSNATSHTHASEMPSILTNDSLESCGTVLTNDSNSSDSTNCDNSDSSSFLSVPNTSNSVSPISPNSMSDSGMILSGTTECSTSSSSETNTMVLSNRSSSTDSLVSGVTGNVDTSNENVDVVSQQNPGNSNSKANEENSTVVLNDSQLHSSESMERTQFLETNGRSLSQEHESPRNILMRVHKPLSRQISHPPFIHGQDRYPPTPRPHNRLLTRVAAVTNPSNILQCPPTPTHHARPQRTMALQESSQFSICAERDSPSTSSSQFVSSPSPSHEPSTSSGTANGNLMFDVTRLPLHQQRMGERCSILPLHHLSSTRLPSIPERSAKTQRLELSSEEEPLPPCKLYTTVLVILA